MCIVIDANAIAATLNQRDASHHDFSPILKWLRKGKGKLVIGGTLYKVELSKMRRYIPVLAQLDIARKIARVDDVVVDKWADKVREKEPSSKLNDAHIVALSAMSRVRVVCTQDVDAMKFIKMRSLYPPRHVMPKIYRDAGNSDLLTDRNALECGL